MSNIILIVNRLLLSVRHNDSPNYPEAVFFRVSSSESTEEFPAGVHPPGSLWVELDSIIDPGATESGNWVIWNSFIADGCVDPPNVVPIEFNSSFCYMEREDKGICMNFEAKDNTTLVSTGFWTFHYSFRSPEVDGNASDFNVRGKVSVLCTSANGLFDSEANGGFTSK